MKCIERKGVNKLTIGEQDQVLVIAGTGHGKSLAIERISEEYFQMGFSCVCLPSPKGNLELGYVGFPAEAAYHKKKLKYQYEETCQHPFKLYHPYCNNLPTKRKLPDFNIFTLDVKRLDRFLNYFLFENSEETIALNLLLNTIASLKKDDSLFDLLRKIKSRTSRSQSRETFGLSASSGGQREVNRIIQIFQRFRWNPLIMPSNFTFNLDMERILNDNKHYHIFTNKYVLDAKTRDFITLYILNEIRRAKTRGKTKHPVVIVLEELKSFCPASPIYNFKTTLNKILSELISICRGLEINFLSSSQIFQEIASEVAGSFSELLIGKTAALHDLFEISKVIPLDAETRKRILGLPQNHFFWLTSEESTDTGTYIVHLPRHRHQERGDNYDRIFERYYPGRMKCHAESINHVKKAWENQEKGVK